MNLQRKCITKSDFPYRRPPGIFESSSSQLSVADIAVPPQPATMRLAQRVDGRNSPAAFRTERAAASGVGFRSITTKTGKGVRRDVNPPLTARNRARHTASSALPGVIDRLTLTARPA
ncbi:MAG UNVERIFIED_CONTAM: hypothetical protein LVR18_45940 [Planctomycetaceae bacterium]